MYIKYVLLWFVFLSGTHLLSQRLIDRSGTVVFFSEAPLENIEAKNSQALAAIDLGKGDVAVSMLMKGFRFEKALMEEHFNENFVESDKFPKATFKGKLKGLDPDKFKSPGKFSYPVEGEITIHGVTKPFSTDVDFTVANNKVDVNAVFFLKVEDFDIKIPMTVIDNIAEEIEVTASFKFDQP